MVILKAQTECQDCCYANYIPKFLLKGANGKFFPSFVTFSTDDKATNKLLVDSSNKKEGTEAF